MIFRFFSLVLKRPILSLLIVGILSLFVGSWANKLEIDASSETLMLNDDKDLLFARKMSKRFKSPDFLIVTFSPKKALLSDESLKTLEKLTEKLSKVENVSSVTSLLNVPLLQSPTQSFEELAKGILTVRSEKADLNLAKKEFLTSPLYKNNLVSKDFKTSAIVLNLKTDSKYFVYINKRNALLKKEQTGSITPKEKKELKALKSTFKAYRDKLRTKEHQNLEHIRAILKEFSPQAKLFLGGVSMIADDMIAYVKSDIILYGVSLLALLTLALGLIFRQFRWVMVPILICLVSVLLTAGILGLLTLEITVISSNFISLQLIITLSITIHLIVQYQEYARRYQKATQKRLLLATMLTKAKPSFYSILTTIVGFCSLIFSGIKPIINLGIMMSLGISVSLLISFVLFASINALLPRKAPRKKFDTRYSITTLCANVVLNHKKAIFVSSFLILLVSFLGTSTLQVENSFINYFKSSTDIYKGMEVIDQELGGTTPLDVIITFKEEKAGQKEEALDEFEAEFAQEASEDKYFFTREKIDIIKKVGSYLESIPEMGNTQSLHTLFKVGKMLNKNKDLDTFEIALLYDQLPKRFKELVLAPYLNIEHNQIRFSSRIIDSNPKLRRNELIKKINADLKKLVPQEIAELRLSSFMILYNNMLQSLYRSQIVTLGFVVFVLSLMFWFSFRSLKVALIAMSSNLIPLSLLFGFMGLANIPLDMMTITIAAISIGMGVDNTIHYIHRFKHEYLHTKSYTQAMQNSHKTIGYAMFYTSSTIMLGFCVLVVSNFIPTIYFGLLTVFAMMLVLMGALVLLPRLLMSLKPYG